MTELSDARTTFLSEFPAQYRDHLVAFATNLSKLEVDVLILTARKTVCLFHCLEYLGLFVPGKRLVISERWMDHDRSWLAGKRVAIVDEVIVTGTSIYKLHRDLVEIGVESVEVHCLFINGTYFVQDFFKNIKFSHNFIKLSGEEAQALSTAIVDAMYSIPRPYSVDYPMSTWTEVPKLQLSRLQALPGWQTLSRHWMGPDQSKASRRVAYYRITPREELAAEIDHAVGANVFERCLVKIRLYGYLSGAGNAKKYVFRIVPYVVLGELALKEFEHIFVQLISNLSLSEQEIAVASCVSEVSRLRLTQYVLSGRLAKYWISQLADLKLSVGFRQDSGELNYIFPSSLHGIVEKLTREVRQPALRIQWPDGPTAQSPNLPDETDEPKSGPTYFRLVEPFSKMYRTKELRVRGLALELGEKIFQSGRYKDLLNRLDKGISVDHLRDFAKREGIGSSMSVLSDFLDLGIDSGVVVPITVCTSVNGTKHLYRAYRHGEETYIVDRDLAMFHAMLDKFAKEWTSTNRTVDSGLVQLPRLVVEKLLVLFMRYAVGSDLLRTSYERLDTDNSRGIGLNVAYHRHGARLSTGRHDPTEFPQDRAFVDFLLNEKVLRRSRSGGYGIEKFVKRDILDGKRRSAATKFGGVMAKALSLPPSQLTAATLDDAGASNRNSPAAIRDRVLVSLTTCETAASTVVAVGAELRLFSEFFSRGFALPVGNSDSALAKLQSVNARFFLNNAMAKINSHLDRVAFVAANRLKDALGEDSLEAAVWTEIWDAAVQHKSIEDEREANNLLLRCLRTAWRLDFNIQLLVLGLLRAKDLPTESVRRKIEEMVHRVGRRGAELARRESTDKNSTKAMAAFSRMAVDLEQRFVSTLTRWDRSRGKSWASPRAIAEELDRERSEAASVYAQIDNRYRERNRISGVERFDSTLAMRMSFAGGAGGTEDSPQRGRLEQGLIRELQSYATRANAQGKPRTYRGAPSAIAMDDVVQVRTVKAGQFLEIQITGRGQGLPAWFGYIVGRFLGYDNFAAVGARVSWIAILGLDETRQFSQATDTDDIVGTLLVDQLISAELSGGAQEGRLICAGGAETRQTMCRAFHDEYSAVRKSQSATRTENTNLGVEALGGTATVFTYGSIHSQFARHELEPAGATPSVLVLATEWSSHHGGLSTFNRMLCTSLGNVGVKVVCAVQEATSSEIEDALLSGIQLVASPADPGAPASSGLFRGFQLPLGFRPTIVIGHGRVTGNAAMAQVADRFQSAWRVHFIHTAPGEIEWFKLNDDNTKRAEEREDVERALSKSADLVAAVGERLFQEAESLLAGSGASLHMFEPGLMNESDAQPLQLDHCLLLGRADDWSLKGLDIAAQAIARLVNERSLPGREIELIVRGALAGTGDALRKRLLEFCLGADVQIRVKEFRAGDDAVERDLKRASLLLMPSRREGFGLVALEAISAGVPVLVSDKSGVAAMIKRHAPASASGVVVSTASDIDKSSIEWAKAIRSVLVDKDAAFRRARELRDLLGQKVSWSNSAEKLMDTILETKRAVVARSPAA